MHVLSSGIYCIVKCKDGVLYRGQVTKILTSQIEVFMIDYGVKEIVNLEDVFEANEEYGSYIILYNHFTQINEIIPTSYLN